MQQLENELAALRQRAKLLDTKRVVAKDDLDQAMAEREKFMLEGDLDDGKTRTRLQSAVDSAISALAGFDSSIGKQATLIAGTEAKLVNENLIADRKAASEVLAGQIMVVEELLPVWLQISRNLAAALENIHWRFESTQMAGFIRNAASEIQNAAALSSADLHSSVARIRNGHQPIPSAPVPTSPPDENERAQK